MVRHRALLIGASAYEMRGVPPLPFIPADLARLGSALEDRGFDDVQVLAGREGGKQVSANYVNARVVGFLRRARPGDTLLILLSGHGVHAKGRDYLVPEDIDEDTHPFESGCVAIDWREHLDETPAEHVVFLIDACREGIEQDSMGVASVKQWSRQKISAALRRKVAYVYACSPGQYALFVRPHDSPINPVTGVRLGDSFSIFSRSVSDVIAGHPGAATLPLGRFQDAVQDRMTELHRGYRKSGQPQSLRVITDIPSDGFLFLPSPSGRSGRVREPSAVIREPSTAGRDADTTAYESAGMGVEAGTPRPAYQQHGVRLGRRVFSALTLLGLLGVAAWAAATYNGDGKGDDAKSNKPGSETSLTPSSSGARPSSTNSKNDKDSSGSGETSASSMSALPDCTPSVAELTVRSLHNAYGPDDIPILLLTAKNITGSDCKVDLGPKKTVLTLTPVNSANVYWSSADCPIGSGSQLFLAPAHREITYTVKWDRKPSAPQCGTSPKGYAGFGTFLAEATAPGFGKAQTSFVLSKY
ncbi:caspase domain-containing protein [Streptomyces sp. NBC_01794]|uniref:caspase family protein n=1 Tax=Streptomyces sp. NBC_01794 TaxID=2975942 RepID=UPI0030932586|nr:caspase family protein [Streptomyces sp. NBC_01794]